jgi:hypothetical protein
MRQARNVEGWVTDTQIGRCCFTTTPTAVGFVLFSLTYFNPCSSSSVLPFSSMWLKHIGVGSKVDAEGADHDVINASPFLGGSRQGRADESGAGADAARSPEPGHQLVKPPGLPRVARDCGRGWQGLAQMATPEKQIARRISFMPRTLDLGTLFLSLLNPTP